MPVEQSDPLPVGRWVKESGALYVDSSGRFRLEGTRREDYPTKMSGWTLRDNESGRDYQVKNRKQGKAVATRLLFEESEGWTE